MKICSVVLPPRFVIAESLSAHMQPMCRPQGGGMWDVCPEVGDGVMQVVGF